MKIKRLIINNDLNMEFIDTIALFYEKLIRTIYEID